MGRSRLLGAFTTVGVVVALGATVAVASSPPSSTRAVLTGSGTSKVSPSSGNSGNTDPATGCNANGNCNGLPKDFGVEVSGVAGLYPGASKSVAVTFRNPNAFPIYVTSAAVSRASLVSSASGTPRCTVDDLVKGSHLFESPGLAVPAKGTRQTNVISLGLRHEAPGACQGATWSFAVSAQAVK